MKKLIIIVIIIVWSLLIIDYARAQGFKYGRAFTETNKMQWHK